MDPQQRKLLEVVYESFEAAGARLEDVSGSKTACYVGNFTWDIGQMQARDINHGAPYHMTVSDVLYHSSWKHTRPFGLLTGLLGRRIDNLEQSSQLCVQPQRTQYDDRYGVL
jgi:hypothetical protein